MKNQRADSSLLMRILDWLGLHRWAWPMRRLHCPVLPQALVLEVGSGGNPYYRSNVLLDAYEETRERHWAPLVHDRPTVLGFVEDLPFRDKAFDFVIASHVLEHSNDPERFLCELQRVAKAGYIEVPDAFIERINPYRDHRLEVTVRNGGLVIRKKHSWCVDDELVELYEHQAKAVITQDLVRRYPSKFHVRYYWNGTIDFKIVNPEEPAAWTAPESSPLHRSSSNFIAEVKRLLLVSARAVLSQHARNASIDLSDLLICLRCRGTDLSVTKGEVECHSCGETYVIRHGVPVMYTQAAREHKG